MPITKCFSPIIIDFALQLMFFDVQGGSAIRSNANLAVYGQGLLKLEGPGDFIVAQRLFVSLFFNVIVSVGP